MSDPQCGAVSSDHSKRMNKFKNKMSFQLEVKSIAKLAKDDLIEEQKKQEDAKLDVFYIKGDFQSYYREQEILGEGCVGLVKRVQRISDEKLFASKMVKTGDEEEVVLNVIREFKNQRQLSHPNIVKVYELYVDTAKGRIYTIMELVQAREMFDVISKLGQYNENLASKIFKQILQSIEYLHANMVCHRDLKPNNIMCNEDGTLVKITDFNVSKFANQDNAHKKAALNSSEKHVLMWTYTGTVAFSAPEIFAGDSYDESVDMWSAGVVLYTMLIGRQPFEEEYVQDLISKISKAEYSFPSDINISTNAKNLIQSCLQVNPMSRIKPDQALNHPWLLQEQNHLPLLNASNKISQNLSKLISRFAAHRKLRKFSRRKLLFSPSLFCKVHHISSPKTHGIQSLLRRVSLAQLQRTKHLEAERGSLEIHHEVLEEQEDEIQNNEELEEQSHPRANSDQLYVNSNKLQNRVQYGRTDHKHFSGQFQKKKGIHIDYRKRMSVCDLQYHISTILKKKKANKIQFGKTLSGYCSPLKHNSSSSSSPSSSEHSSPNINNKKQIKQVDSLALFKLFLKKTDSDLHSHREEDKESDSFSSSSSSTPIESEDSERIFKVEIPQNSNKEDPTNDKKYKSGIVSSTIKEMFKLRDEEILEINSGNSFLNQNDCQSIFRNLNSNQRQLSKDQNAQEICSSPQPQTEEQNKEEEFSIQNSNEIEGELVVNTSEQKNESVNNITQTTEKQKRGKNGVNLFLLHRPCDTEISVISSVNEELHNLQLTSSSIQDNLQNRHQQQDQDDKDNEQSVLSQQLDNQL